MKKRKININKKAKDWKDRYPMVEVTWVDICNIKPSCRAP
jgi:hypothetical protein